MFGNSYVVVALGEHLLLKQFINLGEIAPPRCSPKSRTIPIAKT